MIKKILTGLVLAGLVVSGFGSAALVPAANATVLFPVGGGTGTSTTPGLGQVAAGNNTSICYTPTSTNAYVLIQSSTAPCGIAWVPNVTGGSATTTIAVGSTTLQGPTFNIATSSQSGLYTVTASGTTLTVIIPSNVGYFTNDANYSKTTNNLSDLSSTSTAATNLGLGTGSSPSFVSVTLTSTSTAGAFVSNTTSTSQIISLNGQIQVPLNYATGGCATYTASTTLDGCVNAIYNSFASSSYNTISITGVQATQSQWLNPFQFQRNGVVVNLISNGGTDIAYGGTGAVASSSMNFNFGNPTGHLTWQVYGFLAQGQASLIAAGNTNLATTTGITCGGANGCVGGNFHDLNLNGFGQQIHQTSNAYMNQYNNIKMSGGNGGNVVGNCFYMNPASNSGELTVLNQLICTDPGNSTTTNFGIYFADGANASAKIGSISLDDETFYNGTSNGLVDIDFIHVENPAYSIYGQYIPIYATSSQASQLSIQNLEIANDANSAGTTFQTIIKHGQILTVFAWHLNNYGGQTVTAITDHSLNNGSEAEQVCGGSVSGGNLTNIVPNQAYSAAAAISCWEDFGNSFPWGTYIDSANSVHFRNGNGDVATVTQTGGWTFSNNGSAGSVTITGTESVSQTIGATGQINANGGLKLTGTIGTFTVASMGGGSLTAGTCASTTTALSGSIATSSAAFITTPTVDPGPDFYWETVLIATSSVSTRVCAAGITGTPNASTYVVKVIQ